MFEPLVSIAIPTYNRKSGLLNTIKYFSEQTYSNIEIIISDNCSDDDPTSHVNEICMKDKRIKYFRQDSNIGMAENAKFIWRLAKGKYFLLGSDDDWWHADFISEMVYLLENNKKAVCAFCDFHEVHTDRRKMISPSRYYRARKILGLNVFKYPEHYPLLSAFSANNMIDRFINYISQPENYGKANIHRGLCRKDIFISSFDELEDLGMVACWGFDMLLSFVILIKGEIEISPRVLFNCTVDNDKNYKDSGSKIEYLMNYSRICNNMLTNDQSLMLKKYINIRYFDRNVGFYDEYLKMIFWYISVFKNNNCDLEVDAVISMIKNDDNYTLISIFKKMEVRMKEKKNRSIKKYLSYIRSKEYYAIKTAIKEQEKIIANGASNAQS